MKIIGALFFSLSFLAGAAENFYHEKKIFGTKLTIESPDRKELDVIVNEIDLLAEKALVFMDPDCRWRNKEPECENPYQKESAELQKLADELKVETKGVFDVQAGRGRDFAGLSQGFFIDKVKSKKKVIMDFSGDIYFSGDFLSKGGFAIGEPFMPELTFAKVLLSSGWMIAGSSEKLGAKVYRPKGSQIKMHDDFLQIVLFARPEFKGYRLDAWATALIAGGKNLLTELENIKEFQNSWGYFYFDAKGKPFCSKNISCSLDAKLKVVKVDWF